jgi:predicted MPP superfamily phosphohydrolase
VPIDYALKRHAIEVGNERGRARRMRSAPRAGLDRSRLLFSLLQAGLRVPFVRRLGERNALTPVVRRAEFDFVDLPRAFDGFRILHLSDLHIDGLDGLAETIAARVADLEVDLCVMTGDYRFETGGRCDRVYPHMRTILDAVRARHGVVGVLGNHDYMEEARALGHMGVKMLVNDALEVREGGESVWLVGLDDPHFYECDDLEGTVRRVPENAFKVLLVHTPELTDDAANAGVQLYLCGHTHGGQICLPIAGPVVTNASCARRYTRGAWANGRLKGYTSSGLGCSVVPVRYFCPPEIAVIELRSTTRRAVERPAERVAA